MKLQGLAILFVILILPLSIIIGEYASFQIETFRLERLYDSRLITATHDALKTYQINTFNDELSDIVNNKLEKIEASATTFYNSLKSGFGMQGYTVEDLQQYVPALVYTMYDGYYIYSPYTDVAQIVKEDDGDGDPTNDADVLQFNQSGEAMVYGFKPYVYYSCRYQIPNATEPDKSSDFVINYTLDNYITVKGIVNGEYVNKSGYLVTLVDDNTSFGLKREYNASTGIYTFSYNGQEILPEEAFVDSLVIQEEGAEPTTREYKYIKVNGEKYYYEPAGDTNGDGVFDDQYFFHLVGGKRVIQVGDYNKDFYKYMSQMELNRSAINYYRSAYEFTTWVKNNLGELLPSHAQVEVVKNTGTTPIFEDENIEYASSSFNLHRKEVIRYAIESNLSIAISNYNKYSDAGGNVNFQMPKLKETEWEMVENEISIISFLQGLHIGGKIYNGYTVVTNNKNEEFVDEESIYISTEDGYYHQINDKNFENTDFAQKALQGLLDLDFETRRDGITGKYYVPKLGLASYSSIVGQEKLNTKYDTIYEYLKNTTINDSVKKMYYTALARERWSAFKLDNSSQVPIIIGQMASVYDYLPITEKEETNNGDGIITEGLIRYYNGQNVDGRKNTTITSGEQTSKWKDLSGNYDGRMMDGVFQAGVENNGLEANTNKGYVDFKGVDYASEEDEWEKTGDWVNIGQIKDLNKKVTLETVFSLNNTSNVANGADYYLISNANGDAGGISLYVNENLHICFEIRGGSESNIELGYTLQANDIYHVFAVYDGEKMSIYLKNKTDGGEIIETHKEVAVKINNPTLDTSMALGVNPDGNDGTKTNWGWANIKMYVARIYNVSLTFDQAKQNINATKIGSTSAAVTYEIEIEDTDGVTEIYNMPSTGVVLKKQITVTPTPPDDVLTIKYCFVKDKATDDGTLSWITYTLGDTINRTVSYSNHGYYYLHVKVLDSSGNVLDSDVKRYVFNGAAGYV